VYDGLRIGGLVWAFSALMHSVVVELVLVLTMLDFGFATGTPLVGFDGPGGTDVRPLA
jgi:hypothetical protein